MDKKTGAGLGLLIAGGLALALLSSKKTEGTTWTGKDERGEDIFNGHTTDVILEEDTTDTRLVDEEGNPTVIVQSTLLVEGTGLSLQQTADLYNQPVISSASIAAGYSGADSKFVEYEPNTNIWIDTTQGVNSPFYARGIVGYDIDGMPLYQFAQSGSIATQIGTFFIYSEYLAALENKEALLADARLRFHEARLGIS